MEAYVPTLAEAPLSPGFPVSSPSSFELFHLESPLLSPCSYPFVDDDLLPPQKKLKISGDPAPALPKTALKTPPVKSLSPEAEAKRQKNKVAAKKYRMNKQSEATITELRVTKLTEENSSLAALILNEKAKIADMKKLLVKHGILKE